jgi:effector-binding domain-containing protein
MFNAHTKADVPVIYVYTPAQVFVSVEHSISCRLYTSELLTVAYDICHAGWMTPGTGIDRLFERYCVRKFSWRETARNHSAEAASGMMPAVKGRSMPYKIEVKQSEPTLTAVIRSRVRPEELSKFVPAACGEVWSYFRSEGLPKPGRHTALYLGDGQGSVEVGAEVRERFAGNDRIQCSALPAGRVVSTVHLGPYQRLGEAHTAIREWCAEHGHRLSCVSWEIYGHWEESWNADPSKIRTDIFYLLDA